MKATINLYNLIKRSTTMRVSKSAIVELKAYIEDMVEGMIIPNAEEFARKEGRKTIKEEDIIRAKDLV